MYRDAHVLAAVAAAADYDVGDKEVIVVVGLLSLCPPLFKHYVVSVQSRSLPVISLISSHPSLLPRFPHLLCSLFFHTGGVKIHELAAQKIRKIKIHGFFRGPSQYVFL